MRNMGPGLNSSQDELYFVFEAEKNMGYLASNRDGGQGDYDIYSAYMQGNVEGMPLISKQEEDYVVKNPDGQSGLTQEQEDQLNTLEEIADNVNGEEGNGSNMGQDKIDDYVLNPPREGAISRGTMLAQTIVGVIMLVQTTILQATAAVIMDRATTTTPMRVSKSLVQTTPILV